MLDCFSGIRLEDDVTESKDAQYSTMEKMRLVDHESKGPSPFEQLAAAICARGFDAYIIPTMDAHGSTEFLSPADKRIEFATGFSGSAGTAIVTPDRGYLFVDSRYYTQADQQVDSAYWKVQKVGLLGVPTWTEFVFKLPQGSTVATDASLISNENALALEKRLKSLGLKLVLDTSIPNVVDALWTDRPEKSHTTIVIHPTQFAGETAESKLSKLREAMAQKKPNSAYFVSDLTAIAWLFNLRAQDNAFIPVFFSFALIYPSKKFIVWLQRKALTDEVEEYISNLGGEIRHYERVSQDLSSLFTSYLGFFTRTESVLVDRTSPYQFSVVVGKSKVTLVDSLIAKAQATKNVTEIEGIRAAYLRDGVSWARWIAWLDEAIKSGEKISEWDAAEKLTSYREKNEFYASLAYENISASGENAALPHYMPTAKKSSIIDIDTVYLNDSGPQYLDGTIDTTRTVHFGKPTKYQKTAFTRVLQGHIAVDTAVFPYGTSGSFLDALARAPSFKSGLNYGHGTGHGIGQYLSVHEGPHSLSGRSAVPLEVGMLTSNEPGFYLEGSFGIRTESVLVVKPVETKYAFGDQPWLGFERVTVVPIDKNLVDFDLLSPDEIKWLRAHNKLCLKKLSPFLSDDERALKYLHRMADL